MKYFHNLQDDEKEKILDYKLMVYLCTGTDSEKLEWFKTINIAGEKLTDQELRNAVYSGSWVTSAIGSDYLTGTPIRQDYLQIAIKWLSNDDIEGYMAKHQNDPNALALWQYFTSVITWIEGTFTTKRVKLMKGVDWGSLYNQFKNEIFDTQKLENEIQKLIADDRLLIAKNKKLMKNKKAFVHTVMNTFLLILWKATI